MLWVILSEGGFVRYFNLIVKACTAFGFEIQSKNTIHQLINWDVANNYRKRAVFLFGHLSLFDTSVILIL